MRAPGPQTLPHGSYLAVSPTTQATLVAVGAGAANDATSQLVFRIGAAEVHLAAASAGEGSLTLGCEGEKMSRGGLCYTSVCKSSACLISAGSVSNG